LGQLDALAAAERTSRGDLHVSFAPPGRGLATPELLAQVNHLVGEARKEEVAGIEEFINGQHRASAWLRKAVPITLLLSGLTALGAFIRLKREDRDRRSREEALNLLNVSLEARANARGAELVRAKTELADSEKRYHELVEASPDAIFLLHENR